MTEETYDEFKRAEKRARASMEQDDAECLRGIDTTDESTSTVDAPRLPAYITFGKYLIKTWYSAPYPHEYVQKKVLHICEFCLKYMKTTRVLDLHLKKKVTILKSNNHFLKNRL